MIEGKNRLILIIEDEEDILELLEYTLQKEGYETIGFLNANENVKKVLDEEKIDLILMDRNLPNIEGTSFIKDLRSNGYQNPVIYVTAKDKSEDILDGFEAHADDYITKPFNITIFRKKVSAVLKRIKKAQDYNLYECGDLTIDFDRLAASIGGRPLILSPTEYKILKIFTGNPNILITRQSLLEKLYDVNADFVDEHALTVNINRLRNKIETDERKYVRTVYGMGYIWTDTSD